MAEDIKLYRTEVPIYTGGEQSLVLIENGDQRYGFVSCAGHSDLYIQTHKKVADDLKQYMEDNQVTPVEVQNSMLVRAILEEASMTGIGICGGVNKKLTDLLSFV